MMSDEVNVFMDPYLNIYIKPDHIAVADGLVESFNEEIVQRDKQRNTQLLESERYNESDLHKMKEKESDKPKQVNCSSLNIIESKLKHAREREKQKESRNKNRETQAGKEVKTTMDEKTVGESDKGEISNANMQEECLEDHNNAGNMCAVTTVTHTDQGHDKTTETEEQQEPIRNVPPQITEKCSEVDNKEEMHLFQQRSDMGEEDEKTTDPECFQMDSLEEQHDATMEKVKLTETSMLQNHADVKQPMIAVRDIDNESMNLDMKELYIRDVCLNATTSEDNTADVDQCKVKDNLCLQSDNTVEKESIMTKAETQDYEHLYEVPDVLIRSDEYVSVIDEQMRENFKQLDNVTLNIAVTGSTGAGKSTFINAIRGLKPDDQNSAPTGVIETTMESIMYEHPTMPNVKFWDLPGSGSPKFKAKKYLKELKLETYDFFIIISSERFKESDIMLAKAIKERKKNFYFLRSKIDNDIQAESQRKDFNEQKVLSEIRDECQKNLTEMDNPNVFLISSFDLNKYDFQALTDTLMKELPDHKRDTLILSLPIYSSQILEEKINTFMKQAYSAAIASASIAVAPVPGLSMACDAAILLTFFTKCYHAFGLDDVSIDKLAMRVNNQSLKSVRSSPLVVAIRQGKLSNTELSALTSRQAAIKFAWSMVPGIGSKKAAVMSYNLTLDLLQTGLQELADTAREVLKVAGVADVY